MIEQQDIIDILGQPRKKQNHELIWECPYCSNDYDKDNLRYNEQKGVLWCFRDDTHAKEVLREINKRKKKQMAHIPQYINNQQDYMLYQDICNAMLLGDKETFYRYGIEEITGLWDSKRCADKLQEVIESDLPEKALNYLYKKRKINPITVKKVGLGYDFAVDKWVIPIYSRNEIVGFEYRSGNFDEKRIWREKDTPRCLAWVWGKPKNKTCIVMEGFLDAYCMLQMASDSKKEEEVTIVTCSNGVNGTLEAIKDLRYNNFEEILLCLDNDEAGDTMTEKVIKEFPFIKDHRKFLKDNNVKDANEYMVKYIYD